MVKWFPFKRPRKPSVVPRLRSRSESDNLTKVDLAELTPDVATYLGKAAYVQLVIFENLGLAVASAPTAEGKDAIAKIAALSLKKQRGLVAEIERLGLEPGTLMQPFAPSIDRFRASTGGADWFENLVTCFVTAGFLDEFFVRLAEGLPKEVAPRMNALIGSDSGGTELAHAIRTAINADPHLSSRLAMWGRRLLGDTMLVARGALAASANLASDEARIEPVFTELIASHTRRMDSIGLTA